MTTASLVAVYARSERAIVAEVDGQMVALDVSQGVCFGLNRVATHIWGMLDGSTSVEAVIENLLEVYDVEPATCREQTFDLLAELEANHLVRAI